MANTTVGASVQVEFSSVGQMRKAIKDATSDLIAMQEQFGKSSPQAIEAARKIADLKNRIKEAKEQADLFDPGKRFSAFANAANQIAAGFSAVQGAMALVGSESKDLEKTLVKVQGAIALSQGLSQLKDLGKAYDEVKVVAVDAFRAIKTAIGSVGIGLLIVALGTIVAYWDDIKAAVSGVSEEQKKLNKESEKNLQVQKEKLDAIDAQENTLKLQGKSEKDILNLKITQTNEAIKAAEINLKNSIATTKAQIAASQRNKDILQGIITFLTAPISALLKGIDLIGSAVGKNFDLYNKFTGGIASLVFDPAQVKAEGDASIKEQEKALTALVNQRDGFQLQLNDIDKKANEKRAADNKKSNEEAAKARAEAENILYESRKSLMNKRDAELLDLEKKRVEEEKKLIAAGIKDRSAFDESYRKQKQAIDDKYNAEDQKKLEDFNKQLNKINTDIKLAGITDEREKEREQLNISFEDQKAQILANETLISEQKNALVLALTEKNEIDLLNLKNKYREEDKKKQEEYNQKLVAADQQLYDAKWQAANAAFGLLSTLAGKNEKLQNVIFAVEKAAAIAKIIIDTQKEIGGYFAAYSAIPGGVALAAKLSLGAKIRAGASIASIVATTIGKFRGGGGNVPTPPPPSGGVQTTAPMAPQLGATATAQTLNADAINNLGNTAMRAYVVNSDIQNNDQRNAYLQRNARIG